MSLFTDFVEGFASGLASALSEQSSCDPAAAAHAGDVVEECCRQLGWSVDERVSANEVCLHFNDPLVRIRKVHIGIGGQGTIVGFTVFSAATMPAQNVPATVLAHLLQRNCDLFVAWETCRQDGGNVGFALTYCALAAGLDHWNFKTVCEAMVKEAHDFDAKMHEAGLL